MFQLEAALQAWSQRFAHTEAMRGADVEELEQHVRDSLTALTSHGLSEEEAFLIATRRVGPTESITQEFGKVNGGHIWGHRLFWMLAGFLFFYVCQLTISSVALLSQALTAFGGGSGAMIGYVSIGVTACCWLVLAIGLTRCSGIRQNPTASGGESSRRSGLVVGVGMAFVIVVAAMVKFGSQMAIASAVPSAEFHQSMLISAWAKEIFALLIPIAFLFVMLVIRVKMRELTAIER